VFLKIIEKTRKISGYMYEFQDLTPISGHFRTNFKISGISGISLFQDNAQACI